MKSAMKVFGIKQTVAELRSIGNRVPDGARGQMKRAAERVVEEAKINTPVDWGSLERSIRILKTYGYRGRLQIDIVAGGESVLGRDGMINLDQYAWIIHENYDSLVESGEWTPGKRTQAKMALYPGRVGSGFLTRALESEESKLHRQMVARIGEIVREIQG